MSKPTPSEAREAEKQIFIQRLGELIQSNNITSLSALSEAIGANRAYVGQLLKGKGGVPGAVYLRRLAEELKSTTDHLTGKAESSAPLVSEVSFHEAPRLWQPDSPVDGIPLLGTGFCDDLAVQDEDGGELEVERVLLETDHVVRYIARPPALWAARDAYAISFMGTSMQDRYKQGDVGIVDPRRTPGPGDDVVVQLTDGNGGSDVMTVLVKELVRASGSYVELRQLNPERTFRIPRSQVARMHRIVPYTELLLG